MRNAVLLFALWVVVLAPVYVEWRASRGVRRDARSVVRFEAAREAMTPPEARKAMRR